MKRVIFVLLTILIADGAFSQGLTINGKVTTNGTEYVNKNGAVATAEGVNKYGKIVAAPYLAVVSTAAISGITAGTAISGGEVTDDGGAPVTRGICWSISTSPTIALSTKTSNGTGTGTFSSNLTRLTPGTTYYVRAYATNSAGTAYGEERSFTTSTVAIGDNFGGGRVAYILQPGDAGYDVNSQHGLIARASDLPAQYIWGTSAITIVTSTNLGTGAANTAAIVSAYGNAGSYAARACQNHSVSQGGITYNDWYLPSKDELNKLYVNQASIGGFNTGGTSFYWSSSQADSSDSAWIQLFNSGGQSASFSVSLPSFYVRPVRSF